MCKTKTVVLALSIESRIIIEEYSNKNIEYSNLEMTIDLHKTAQFCEGPLSFLSYSFISPF